MAKWYEINTDNSNVVLCSKISLSRNFEDFPFVDKITNEQIKTITKRIFASAKNTKFAQEFDLVNTNDLSKARSYSYVEKGLISKGYAGPVLLSKDERVSIPICDKNHFCINSYYPGKDLNSAYSLANEIDDAFIKNFKIAYSKRLGFLTTSPTELGTAMQACYYLHLQGLTTLNRISNIANMISKLGVSLEEVFDNGAGCIYALKNKITLGITEKSVIENLDAICNQIIRLELEARDNLMADKDFEDKIFRTLGILKLARKLSTTEFINSLSLIRLGVYLGYFDYEYSDVQKLYFELTDASLVEQSSVDLSQEACEMLRAEKLREILK